MAPGGLPSAMRDLSTIRAVAFDLDCTLVDVFASKRRAAMASARAARRAGETRDEGEIAERVLAELVERGLDVDDAPSRHVSPPFADVARRAFVAAEARAATAYPRARETVLALKARGYLLALVTDAPRRFAQRRLRASALSGLFHAEVTREDTRNGKLDSAPFALASTLLRVPPERMLAVGDHPARDVASAAALGCATALASYGVHHAGDAAPDLRLAAPSELLDWLPPLAMPANTGRSLVRGEAVA